ncbi:FAD-dependent oxidoreductase [Marinicellulosiphila megalodicopiae]|uniref:oxidoreductase n=1 Tax=Marinicellulosiphila megalodicopiae TaxID=2724896 RepID=UPI003BAFB1B0
MSQSSFNVLFKPINALDVRIKNRFIMGSMHTGLEDHKKNFDELAQYYKLRAQGGVGLIVTGGFAPNVTGWAVPFSGTLQFSWQVKTHKKLTDAIKGYDCKLVLQILHTGRYGFHPFIKSADTSKAPINVFTAKKLSTKQVQKQINAFVRCADLSARAGYDGVEVMGSEGYLINQFLSKRTNSRDDVYGGSLENRMRLAVEIVSKIRANHPKQFLIIFRLSMVELVENGLTLPEIIIVAKAIEQAGASIINTGIGWHEARIPTIVTQVPKAAYAHFTAAIKQQVSILVCASNRINTAEVANEIVQTKQADLVSMARPFLADPDIVNKIKDNQLSDINHCIGCNQACLDHVFVKKRASCLVNPLACYETQFDLTKVKQPKQIAIVGAGPSGLAAAYYAALKGHYVSLFEKSNQLGGQFLLAQNIPGKEDYLFTIEYYEQQLAKLNVQVFLNKPILDNSELDQFDHILNATGIIPRDLGSKFKGENVFSYERLLKCGSADELIPKQSSVAVIGAGGIGFDVCEFLLSDHINEGEHNNKSIDQNKIKHYFNYWGVDQQSGLLKTDVSPITPIRNITLLQRKNEKLGKYLSKTTGWVHRLNLKKEGVKQIAGVSYQKIDEQGLHIIKDDKPDIIKADYFVICAGQVSVELNIQNDKMQSIGGALNANQLDAKVAIRQALEWAISIN